MKADPNAVYDRRRCRICGCPWESYVDDRGVTQPGHPRDADCDRYRPKAEENGRAEDSP